MTEKIDLVEYVTSRYECQRASRGVMIRCPFHDDNHPSMYITEAYAYCFVCGKGLHPDQFVNAVGGDTRNVQYVSAKPKRERKIKLPAIKYVTVAEKSLWQDANKVKYLRRRGLAVESIKRWRLGYMRPPLSRCKLPRFSFPVFDASGILRTISYRQDPALEYGDEYPDSGKYIIHPGTESIMFGLSEISDAEQVLYVGGQIDAMMLNQHGIPAVGSLGEAGFQPHWTSHFDGKKVFIFLDHDPAGIAGSEKAKFFLPDATIIYWPEGTPLKYDVTDAIKDKSMGIRSIRNILVGAGYRFN